MNDRQAVLSTNFIDDLRYWIRTDRRTALRLVRIIDETLRDPFQGVGKPEPLRRELSGLWSRRLTEEHRIVYEVSERTIRFLQGRSHY